MEGSNQKLHQWVYKKISKMLEYKADSVSIKVEYQEESYTTQACPGCGKRHINASVVSNIIEIV